MRKSDADVFEENSAVRNIDTIPKHFRGMSDDEITYLLLSKDKYRNFRSPILEMPTL